MKKVIIFAICILSFCATALIIFAISPNNDDNIYLNHTQIEMNLKDNAKLIVTQGKNDIDSSRIAWSSENKSIVEVDDRGVLIPKGYGNTTVYAKYSGSTLSCKVTVSEIFVASVEIGYDYSTISVGEEEQLSVSIRPSFADNKNIYWSSSNPFIVSVDQSGHVVGLDEGSTSIVAKSSNNKISSFELTVLKEVVYTSFELNNQEVTLNISFSETLNYIAQPNNTVNKTISWQSSNSDIVEVNQEGRITAKKVGSATITATTSNGLQSQCVVEVPVAPIYKMEIINKTNNMISVKSGYQIECKV